MIFEKIVSEGLAHNSYIIGSGGTAAVIDPKRDIEEYIDLSQKNDFNIKYIFETHRNEDYVIGSKELKNRTGAEIYHGSKLDFKYGKSAKENDTFDLGLLKLEILETPGHTDESISITVKDKKISDDVFIVFTGDALFAGDTGRIDLYGEKQRNKLSEKLYNSLHKKILPLGDGVIICSAHGQGSVCGGEISDHEYTTIGYEKKTNKTLSKSKNDFIEYKTNEHHYIPPYFKQMENYNKNGPKVLDKLPHLKGLAVREVKHSLSKKAQILDIRSPTSFAGGYIPGSLNIWRNGIPMFSGYFLDYTHPIIIVDDFNENIKDITKKLIRLGYDNIQGYLKKGFSTWANSNEEIATIDTWTPKKLNKNLDDETIYILDVRNISNWTKPGHIRNANQIYVGELEKNLDKIPKNKNIVVYCDSGFKTSIASSYLKKKNYPKITNLSGGILAWENAGYELKTEG